ncbi:MULTISPECIES: helix-turn-helix domain-containing protein [pseudomallei group]|uniref:DNA-binding regulatory protein n=2 Tax=Pseudomonadota TaxID=1224 RepID=Q63NB6_BURPS|nr:MULTISPECIES: helix-turn-helix transcriptional regulator [pseudomallei group]ARL53656.1 transcriptional regulator [Burkholderia pseudomallei]AVR07694.1 XRE family transcriptional regulator [Burkholderia thailandensis]AWY60952.1 transcriptional regulator [Burkholderia thailandensis]AWY65012.1 transcriptional regulator [Burkholderia thailandensis]AYX38941.1 XRE family transcriptional regulator [Burkholderia pseudomallei]
MARVSGKLDKDGNLVLLGAAIRARRKELAMSQEVLADFVEIDRSHLGKIERGERNVTFMNIIRIARVMQLLPSELLRNAGL